MLPRISIWSLFRDDAGDYITRYRERIARLQYPAGLLRLYLVEGDSRDNTLAELQAWAKEDNRVRVFKHDTGLRRHGSTTDPERFFILRQMGNVAIDAIAEDDWGELAMLIESDLEYGPDLLQRLLETRPKNGVIAPMIWSGDYGENTYRFYDIWAFRYLDGSNFNPVLSSWYAANHPAPFEVQSVGSIVIFPMEAIRAGARYTDEAVIRGMVLAAREQGYKIYCAPAIHVIHPTR